MTRSLPAGEARHDSGTGVPGITRVGWKPDGQSGPWATTVDGADAVINLAGEGISDRRWTPQRKAQLRDSRIIPTRSRSLPSEPRPRLLTCSSVAAPSATTARQATR